MLRASSHVYRVNWLGTTFSSIRFQPNYTLFSKINKIHKQLVPIPIIINN